ncbi:MAG TPA: hypothetical protein PLS36_00910 [Clostridia bacterium]|jgi:hypothetical protein|nr:hypothetical protein [Clostridia bacterium]MDD3093047.1 hypothetical protein [Clostridia bacterium]NLF37530.1 hypothetical protein [Clostridiaceae bacterium]HPJ75377.1 hypothetical protein [Clostridia bacterium]HXK71260.1 hypothetical protein [Clostridia bacterium]
MKKKTIRSYDDQIHFSGRLWMLGALVLFTMLPLTISVLYDAWPSAGPFFKALAGVAPIFWTVGLIEIITYTPMLGSAGSYLSFVTGNISNLKAPVALNAMNSENVKPGTDEGEVISAISIAVSSLVTIVIIAIGVLGLSAIRPLLESETLKPAFANILPALFGGLGVVYVSKNWKIALAPLIFMLILFIVSPIDLSGYVGILVPVGAIIAIVSARILYKKNKI